MSPDGLRFLPPIVGIGSGAGCGPLIDFYLSISARSLALEVKPTKQNKTKIAIFITNAKTKLESLLDVFYNQQCRSFPIFYRSHVLSKHRKSLCERSFDSK